MARYLVVKSRHIGDVLLVGPLVSALRRADPGAHITVAAKRGTEAALRHHPDLDEVLAFPARERREGGLAFLGRQLRFYAGLRGRFDVVINTTEGDRGAIAALFAGGRLRIGYRSRGRKAWRNLIYNDRRERYRGMIHAVLSNQELLPAGVAEYRRVRLGFAEEERRRVDERLAEGDWDGRTPLIQVHPTSRWFFKCWSDAGVAAAIDHLQGERGCRVVVTCGPDRRERDKLDAILALCRTRPLDFGGELSLGQLAALTARCALYFGVDTAPMHFAAALDVPVVAVYGPTGVYDWGPWPNDWPGEHTPYRQVNGIQYAGPHTVIQQQRPCIPCGRDGCEGSKRSDCLEELAVETVLRELDGALERNGVEWPGQDLERKSPSP